MYRLIIILTLSVVLPYGFLVAANDDTAASTLLPTQRRCFQFTWLGPRYTNISDYMNATCADATRLSSGVPCFQPLVASYDGTWPDLEYIWRNYPTEASCVLADNDVCATYTYYFDGRVENSTYMCSRAVNQQGQAITSGCYTQTNGSSSTRACFCRSLAGGVPCNNALSLNLPVIVLVLTTVIMLRKDMTDLLWK